MRSRCCSPFTSSRKNSPKDAAINVKRALLRQDYARRISQSAFNVIFSRMRAAVASLEPHDPEARCFIDLRPPVAPRGSAVLEGSSQLWRDAAQVLLARGLFQKHLPAFLIIPL